VFESALPREIVTAATNGEYDGRVLAIEGKQAARHDAEQWTA
jgi:hypothetical protein